jgi:RNA polymerase-binding transcription factor DksA
MLTVLASTLETRATARLAGFPGFLRANGFAVGAADGVPVLRTAQWVGVLDPDALRWSLQALLCGRADEWLRFDELFDAWFLPADPGITGLYACKGANNMTGFCDPALDDLLERSDHALTLATRKPLLDRAQERLAESAEVDFQEELGFALMQMKAETLERTNDALRRLEAGTFGVCASCGDEISEARLRALPFALRCTECEATRERATGSSRNVPRRVAGSMVELR